jgi:hypothetical protein
MKLGGARGGPRGKPVRFRHGPAAVTLPFKVDLFTSFTGDR